MKVILVRVYKSDCIRYDQAAEKYNVREGRQIEGCGANDVFVLEGSSIAITNALAAEGHTDADVVSVTAVPYQVNERDVGSTDYYVSVRTRI